MKTLVPKLLIIFSLGGFVFLPNSQAVAPPPDGGYPGGNTAEGQSALLSLTSGLYNTGVGIYSLLSLTNGSFCTGVGAGTLLANVAPENTATGAGALLSNTIGDSNTAHGAFALFSNTTGTVNTATGNRALFNNVDGHFNTAVGQQALFGNISGQENTALGFVALANHPTGNFNTAVGTSALLNTTGTQNTAVGAHAMQTNETGNSNTAIGNNALIASTGSGNTALGQNAGAGVTTASNVICIGNSGTNVDHTCFIGQIRGVQTQNANAIPVLIDSAGQLGTQSSSRRFKKEIKAMDKASEAILALKPVTFQYKNDKENTPQFGLIAEEVAQVNSDLVARDENGAIYTVRYDQVNAMLLNEFLKEHRKVEEQQGTISELKNKIETVVAHSKEQDAKIQKVSAQIELNRSRTKLVDDN